MLKVGDTVDALEWSAKWGGPLVVKGTIIGIEGPFVLLLTTDGRGCCVPLGSCVLS